MQLSVHQRSHVTKGVSAVVSAKHHSLVEIQPVFLPHHAGGELEFSLAYAVFAEPAFNFKFGVAYRLGHGQTVSRLLLLLLILSAAEGLQHEFAQSLEVDLFLAGAAVDHPLALEFGVRELVMEPVFAQIVADPLSYNHFS